MSRWPDFLCIGAQKTGTTWLWKLLKRHPSVCLPRKKELHFFDREILHQPLSWYRAQFEASTDEQICCGEKTPNYASLKPEMIRLVRGLLPDLRLILILRTPDERSWSQARMEVSHYNQRPLGQQHVWRCLFHLGLTRNVRLTRYDRMLRNWRRFYPADQILVLFHEDIGRDPDGVLQKVCAFLDIQPSPDWTAEARDKKVWKSPDLEMPPTARWYLRRRYAAMTRLLAQEFPQIEADWLRTHPEQAPGVFRQFAVRILSDVATLPNNLAYYCYDLIRDVRFAVRRRQLASELQAIIAQRNPQLAHDERV